MRARQRPADSGAALPLRSGLGTVRSLLAADMWLLVAAYVVALAVHGRGFEPLVDGWLGALIQLVPAAVCWAALPGAGARHGEVACLALGMTSWAVGNAVDVYAAAHPPVPFPSPGELGFLCCYPALLAALVLAVRRELGEVRGTVWLDSALAALAAAAGLSVLLQPAFDRADGTALQVGVAATYPISDLLLVAALVGITTAAARSREPPRTAPPVLWSNGPPTTTAPRSSSC